MFTDFQGHQKGHKSFVLLGFTAFFGLTWTVKKVYNGGGGGNQPPSEKDSREASTGLGWVSYLASGLAPNQGVLRPVHRKVSRVARQTQRHASPIVLHLASLSGVSRFGVPLN